MGFAAGARCGVKAVGAEVRRIVGAAVESPQPCCPGIEGDMGNKRGAQWTLSVAALFGLATAVNAATLTIEADRATYNVGDTIALSINGDAEGAIAFSVYARLLFNGLLVDNGTRTQQLLGSGWTNGILQAGDNE